jgi:hypothetical protein
MAIGLILVFAIVCSSGQRTSEGVVHPTLRPADHFSPVSRKPNPCLHIEGNSLKDGSGKIVVLRGVNLGGWLLWEGWIWGGGLTSESALRERIDNLVGPDVARNFEEDYYAAFITEQDIARIASLGFNVVRIPINHRLLSRGGAGSPDGRSGWGLLDNVIGWSEKHGVYVVLTLHSAPGGQSRVFTADPAKFQSLWASETHQMDTVGLWKKIAERYKDRKIIAGYDLLNEPSPKNAPQLKALYSEIIKGIREVDPCRMVILEGSRFSTNFSMLDHQLDSNQLFGFHMYTWFGDNRRRLLSELSRQAKETRTPLWLGEFGENKIPMIESTRQMVEEPAYGFVGWAFWTWKKVPKKFPALFAIQPTPAWQKFIQWVSAPRWPNEKPTAEEAKRGIAEFLTAVRHENNAPNNQMIKALTGNHASERF